MIVFGSESDSFVGRYAPTNHGNTVGVTSPPHPLHQFDTAGDKTMLNDPVSPSNDIPDFKEKVQAIHACKSL